MKRRFLTIFFLCFLCLSFSGCGKISAQKAPLCRVVTQVEITGREKDVQIYRKYTQEEKTRWILVYLNTLKPDIRPIPKPDDVTRSHYEITLTFSDGKQKIYRQAAHRFFQTEQRPWKAIPPAQAAGLYSLLRALSSDL